MSRNEGTRATRLTASAQTLATHCMPNAEAPATRLTRASSTLALATLLAACSPTPTLDQYENLERRVTALEAELRERDAAAKEAARGPDPDVEHGKRLAGELALLGQPAPALTVAGWAQGEGRIGPGPTLLVFFPVGSDATEPLRRVRTLTEKRRVTVLGIARGATLAGATAWVKEAGVPFPVALDDGEATTTAYARSSPVSAVLVKSGAVVWTGTAAGLDAAVLDKHL